MFDGYGGGVMMPEERALVFLDGKVFKADSSLMRSLRPGILKAEGAFETLRSKNFKIYALQEHFNRLKKGLKQLNIHWIVKKEEVELLIKVLLRVSRIRSAKIRLCVWQGGGGVHTAVVIAPLNLPKRNFRLTVSRHRRTKTPLSKFKTLNYQIFYKAFREALDKKYDEAVLLNPSGFVVEGSRTNIFIVKDKKIFTPPLSAGCLKGVTRDFVREAALRLKIACLEKNLKIDDLLNADEVFVTNSLIGLVTVSAVDQKKFVVGSQKGIIQRLLEQYRSLIERRLK